MSKLRSVNTAFWSDPLIEELNPKEKLLFLYLITNEKTNMLGIYESSIKKMSFETGLTSNEVDTILKRLEGLGRVKYMGNWVLLVNYMKHQNYNANMKISALNSYLTLPKELEMKPIEFDPKNPSEGFETLLKRLGTVSKYEVEGEGEKEDEDMSDKPDFNILFEKYVLWLNNSFGKKYKVDTAKNNCFTKFKEHFKSYKNDKELFASDLNKVAKAIKADTFHIESKFKYITPEFILRPDKFEKFLNVEIEGQISNSDKWTDPSQIDINDNDWASKIPTPPQDRMSPEYRAFCDKWRTRELKEAQVKRVGYYDQI